MKRTSFITFSIAVTLFGLIACSGQNEYYQEFAEYEAMMEEEMYQEPFEGGQAPQQMTSQSNNNPKIEMKPMVSPTTGQVTGYMPLPRNWKVTGGKITGPGNIEVQEYQFQKFDRNMRRVLSAKQVVEQIFAPEINGSGGRITNIYPLNDIARKDAQNSNQFYSEPGIRKSFDAVGVDAITPEGQACFLIIHQMSFDWGMGGMWGYFTHAMIGDKSQINDAKKALIYGLVNARADANFVNNSNRQMQAQSQQSWAAHNQRMRNNQAAFNASQSAYQSNNDVSDIYHNMWKNQNASSDRMQEMSVRGIHETEIVTNPHYGQQYEVQSGYDRYFMNNSGQYFGTNDQFYQEGSDLYNNGQYQEAQRRGN